MVRENPHKGEQGLEIGGRKVKLVPTFANLVAIEVAADAGLIEMARRMASGSVRLKDLVAVVTVASEPQVSEKELATAVEAGGMVGIIEAASQFVLAALTGGSEGNVKAAEKS